MASAISPDPAHRQSLSTFRTMGGTLAGLLIGVGLPLFAFQKINGKETLIGSRVTAVVGVFSVLAVGCYLLCYHLVTERVRPEPTKTPPLRRTLTNAVRNRALLSIIAASVVMLLAQLTLQTMAGYIFPDYYNNATAQSVSTLLMVGAMAASAAVAGPLSRRFGKAEISVVANLFAALICVVLFFLRPANVWVYVAFQTLCWLGLGLFSMVNWALITDVIDYAELQNGVREDGAVYALYSFARKLGQAAASGVSGVLLSVIGYTGATAQVPAVRRGLFTLSTLIPAAGFLALALVLWFWYPLHKRQVAANVAALQAKHEREKS